MKYVDAARIEWYLKLHPKFEPTPEKLADMVNFFAEGAVTSLSNVLYEYTIEGDCELRFSLEEGCRCGSCHEWQLYNPETNEIVKHTDKLSAWVEK